MVINAYAAMLASAAGALLCASLLAAYFAAPARELRRQASRGSRHLHKLIIISDYPQPTRLLLGALAYALAIITAIITIRALQPLSAFITVAFFVAMFSYVLRRETRLGLRLADFLASYLEPVVRKLDPLVRSIGGRLSRKRRKIHTHLYEKDDLKEIIRLQKKAANNRIDQNELDNALQALDFGSKKVNAHMVAHKDIAFVTTKEPIGPILLSELHKSGFSSFPVQGNSTHEVVGMLQMDDLVQHTSGGLVGNVMDTKVLYVSEDYYLEQVLQAFHQTGKRVFMVIDAHEKIVGLISVGDVLEQILGHAISSDIESYDNPAAVAHGSAENTE